MLKLACRPVLLLVVLTGCPGDDTTASGSEDEVEATGIITSLVDNVPADGGVTIDVTADGSTTTFHIRSFFTPEPVPQERWELYEHVKTFSVGDEVRATGEKVEDGVLLTGLERTARP